jgi:alpha-tubulin suppressor-like RCC1 family protein
MQKITISVIASVLIRTVLITVPSFSYAQDIAGGFYHSAAICADHGVMAWGNDAYGQLGDGVSGSISKTPVQTIGLAGVKAVSGGVQHTVALRDDGTAWTWGSNLEGELGNGSPAAYSNVPVQVVSLAGVTSVASGMQHALALRNDGTVWAWGYNGFGQLGTVNPAGFSNIPLEVNGIAGITAIAGGAYHSLALKGNGEVWAWGYNGSGELGNGTNTNSPAPVAVTGLTGVVAIACGNSFSVALRNDGTVWAWGGNLEGELGNGGNTASFVPVQVTGLTSVTAIGCGVYHALAVRNDGTVWSWGFNLYGQLGNGSNTDSHVPVQVAGLSGITSVAGGYGHSLALKSDGTVWDWGYNNYGQLGNGTLTDTNVPGQVSGLCQVATAVQLVLPGISVSVFPNPFKGGFSLTGTRAGGSVIVYDLAGKEVLRQTTGDTETVVNAASLSAGSYLLRYTAGQTTANMKIVAL